MLHPMGDLSALASHSIIVPWLIFFQTFSLKKCIKILTSMTSLSNEICKFINLCEKWIFLLHGSG